MAATSSDSYAVPWLDRRQCMKLLACGAVGLLAPGLQAPKLAKAAGGEYPAVYDAYRAQLLAETNTYGWPHTESPHEGSVGRTRGLCFARLIDLGGHPAGQMLLAYSSNGYGHRVELWDYDATRGEPTLVWTGNAGILGTNGGLLGITLCDIGGVAYYEVVEYYGSDALYMEDSYYRVDNGALRLVKHFSLYDYRYAPELASRGAVDGIDVGFDAGYEAWCDWRLLDESSIGDFHQEQVFLTYPKAFDGYAPDPDYLRIACNSVGTTLDLLNRGAAGETVRPVSPLASLVTNHAKAGTRLSFRLTENPQSPHYATVIYNAEWATDAWGCLALMFWSYRENALYAYPQTDADGYLEFAVYTEEGVRVQRVLEPNRDGEKPSYWLSSTNTWY